MDRPDLPASRPPVEPEPSQPRASLPIIASALVLALALLVLVQVAIRDRGNERSTGLSTASPVPSVQASARSQPLAVGEPVPAFTAPGLSGGRVAWDDYLGGAVVLAVWAPWCPHCQAELPVLARVTSEFSAVRMVSVVTAVDPASRPTPLEYMRAEGLDFPVAVDDASGTLARAFGIRAFPTLYFVGADGAIRAVHEGEMSAADLRRVLAGL